MKKLILITLTSVVALSTGCCQSTSKNRVEAKVETSKSQIFPKGEIINNDYFSGEAWLQMLVTDKENFDATIGSVVFEPGVRNNWHSHPGGQILLCTDGEGYYQEKGQPIRLLHKGDVVEIQPDVIHWHGATPNGKFTHIAVTTQAQKGSVMWLEPVRDEEYNSYKE